MKQTKHYFAIARLIEKFLHDELTAEEAELLQLWVDESEAHKALWDKLTSPAYLEEKLQYWEDGDDKAYHWKQLAREIAKKQPPRKTSRKLLRYAAILIPVILLCGAGMYIFKQDRNSKQNADDAGSLAGVHIMPRGKVARLVLANGKIISLKGNIQEAITEGDGTVLRNQGSGLSYIAGSGDVSGAGILYNVLMTPRGGEYQVKLSDGTKVWLNAASSLRYPARFEGEKRSVYLSGEAYFEVAPDAQHPFTVYAGKTVITVLGTKFNVSAYPDGPLQKMTLAEGLIQINRLDAYATRDDGVLLQPGYEAIVKENDDSIYVSKANVEAALGWKNGMFIFDYETLGCLMRKLSRWYDVDVKYDKGVDSLFHFTGRIQRYGNITGILHLIALTGKVQFSVKGKEVEIKPK